MDRRIISFNTKAAANKLATELHSDHVLEAQAKGYTVVNNEIIGKVNGVDNPNAQRTIAWTKVEDSLDGTFTIEDESVDALFDSQLAKQGSFTRKTIAIISDTNQ